MQPLAEQVARSGHELRVPELLHHSVLLGQSVTILRHHRPQEKPDRGLLQPAGGEALS
ncbi:MAG: hypothetical protein JY451_11295 [Erythrobacter sp.]|nr:MAG: hypothetical protein JY451_11295 [Erythrobacter sp.]